MIRSQFDLLSFEREALQQRALLSKMSFWKRKQTEMKLDWNEGKNAHKKVKIKLFVPAKMTDDLKELIHMLPKEKQLGLDYIFNNVANQIIQKYAERVDPKRLYQAYIAKKGQLNIKVYNKEQIAMFEDLDDYYSMVRVEIPYRTLLYLERISEQVASVIPGAEELTAEDLLQVYYVDHVKGILTGQYPNLARDMVRLAQEEVTG